MLAVSDRTNPSRVDRSTSGADSDRAMDYAERISAEPGKRGGQPTIRGLRITVSDVLGYLAAGMSEDEILADFPDLARDDIRAALAYAAERTQRVAAG
jgi:uncharacterized protein (DUF433 family)